MWIYMFIPFLLFTVCTVRNPGSHHYEECLDHCFLFYNDFLTNCAFELLRMLGFVASLLSDLISPSVFIT